MQMSERPSSSDPVRTPKTISSDAPSDRLACDRSEPVETENVDGVSDPKDDRFRTDGRRR